VNCSVRKPRLSDYQPRKKQVQEKIGGIKGKLEYYTRRETEKLKKKKQMNAAVKEAAIYHELAEAFGKKGIQALLIETALPEIENEANRLLAKMTDNRMHVKIETRKRRRRAMSPRRWKSRSRTNWVRGIMRCTAAAKLSALISRSASHYQDLLARRAGAPLPTLIIDEGFGTQDAAGIEKLKKRSIRYRMISRNPGDHTRRGIAGRVPGAHRCNEDPRKVNDQFELGHPPFHRMVI